MQNLTRDYASVIYNEAGFLSVTLFGFCSLDEFIEISEYEYSMVRLYKIKSVLINLKSIHIYPRNGEEYIKNVWYNRMKEEGLYNLAVVAPEDVFAKMSMAEAHKAENKSGLNIDYFSSVEDAEMWLKEQ